MTSEIAIDRFDGKTVTYQVFDVNSSEKKFDGIYKAPVEQFNEFRKERPNDIISRIEVIDNYKKECKIDVTSFNGKVLTYEVYGVYVVFNLDSNENMNSSETFEEYEGTYEVSIEQFIEIRKERPNDNISWIEVIHNYGIYSKKTEEERKKLIDLMIFVFDLFIKSFQKNNKLEINIGHSYWHHLKKINNPYDKNNLLTDEYYRILYQKDKKQLNNSSIKFNVRDSRPSIEWCEFKSPIEFIVSLLEIVLNIKISILIDNQYISRHSKRLKAINGEYSWVTILIYNP